MSAMKAYRASRINAQIQRELAAILDSDHELSGARMVTVTEVRVSRDYHYADVWISVFGGAEERRKVLATIAENQNRARQLLARRMTMKFIPELRFILDTTLDYAERIDELLHQSGLAAPPTPAPDNEPEQQQR